LCKINSNAKPNPIALQVRFYVIDQILINSSNAAQWINWSAAQRDWSNAQLTKCATHSVFIFCIV